MADAHAKPHHDYHLVDPSPWPIIGAVSAFLLAVGAITWMHHMFAVAPVIFVAGAIGTLYTMLGWWRDVAREATYQGYHTRVVQISHRYGMILFIASEVMFFVAWFWAYFNTALFPHDVVQQGTELLGNIQRSEVLGGQWPPKGIETFDPWHLPLLNTLILLTSGTTVTWAHPARPHFHGRAGLRIQSRCLSLFRQHLRRHLLHGDRLPWRPRDHRLDLSDRLPDPRLSGPFHAGAAPGLRVLRLVLALCRRGVVVLVCLHLC